MRKESEVGKKIIHPSRVCVCGERERERGGEGEGGGGGEL